MPALCKRIPVEFGNELSDALFHFAVTTSNRGDVISIAALPTIHAVRNDVEYAHKCSREFEEERIAIVALPGDSHTFPIILEALLAWADNAEETGTETEWHSALTAVGAWVESELEVL